MKFKMKTTILYSDELKNYDFGPGHPFRSDRFVSFLKLYKEKLGKNKHFELVKNNELASDEELEFWHTKTFSKIGFGMMETSPNIYRLLTSFSLDKIESKKGILNYCSCSLFYTFGKFSRYWVYIILRDEPI
ncbi:hypothetical protein ES703_93001 [subsurface metagenome]